MDCLRDLKTIDQAQQSQSRVGHLTEPPEDIVALRSLGRFEIDYFCEISQASTVFIQQSGELGRGAWTSGLSNDGQSLTNARIACDGADIRCNPVSQCVGHSAFAEKPYHAVHSKLRESGFGYGRHVRGKRH